MPAQNIPLPRLNEYLARVVAEGQSLPGYVRAWQLATAAKLPGARREYGHWLFDEADVPAIAQSLGLTLKPRRPARSRARAVANG